MEQALTPLTLDAAPRVRFRRNTIQQAVCELRFPTLPDIANDPPRDFVMRIRKEFPTYKQGVNLKIGITDSGMEQVPLATHRFVSRDKFWTAWLRTSSLGLETTHYHTFEDFLLKLELIMNAAEPCLDTDFFTRVGLRYINFLPADAGDARGWLNDDLLGPLGVPQTSGAERCWVDVRGETHANGTYSLRYGLTDVEGDSRRYVLDTDFAVELVEWSDTVERLRELHQLSFNLFYWAIGPRTMDYLGDPIQKEV